MTNARPQIHLSAQAVPYALSVLLCVLALIVRGMLHPLLNNAAPFTTFIFAVLITARYAGYGPGLAAIGLSGLLGNYFFLPPHFSLAFASVPTAVSLVMFLVLGLAINTLMASWRQAKTNAELQARRLDDVLEAMAHGVIVVAPSGYITFANTAAAQLFGLLPSHMVGRLYNDPGWSLRPVSPEGGDNAGLPFLSARTHSQGAEARTFAATGLGGKTVRLLISAAPLHHAANAFAGVVFSLTVPLGEAPTPDEASLTPENLTSENLTSEKAAVMPVPVLPSRVLYLDHTAKLSGGEIALLRLLEATDRAQVYPIVLLAEEGPIAARLREAGVETHVLPLSGRVRDIRKDTLGLSALRHAATIIPFLSYAVRVARFARQHSVQILHANSLKADLYGALAGWLARLPVVWHVRDHIDPSYLPAPAVYAFRFLAQHVPAYVITNSQSTLDRLFLSAGRPSAVVPSGLDLPGGLDLRRAVIHDGLAEQDLAQQDIVSPDARLEPAWASPVRIGIVGRLAPWKGQHVFLEAAARLQAAGHDARFVIVGAPLFGEDGYEAELRRQAAAEGLTGQVTFLGFRSDVAAVLGELDILVHASTTPEPFGQVVIEGMAESLPVVATDGGGVREIITHAENGLLVPMGDAGALASALERLLQDPALARRLGSAGYRHVRQHFTAHQSARRVEKVYSDILSS